MVTEKCLNDTGTQVPKSYRQQVLKKLQMLPRQQVLRSNPGNIFVQCMALWAAIKGERIVEKYDHHVKEQK